MAHIRNATEQDAPAIADIYKHYVKHAAATFEIDPPDWVEIDRRRIAVRSHGLPYLVAEISGQVTGFAYASPYRSRPGYRFTIEDSVYVHPDHCGFGLGRMLLARLIELCDLQVYRQMIAIIGDSENLASIRLHERLGFRRVGVLESVGRKFGRWIDTVMMQRALGHGCAAEFMAMVAEQGSRIDLLKKAADFIRRSDNYRWVGIYDVDHAVGEVRNLVFDGPGAPTYPRFPIDAGLTGVAIREGRTVNVGDVAENPVYLTALGTTRSEIIIPIFDGARRVVVGTLDVESEKLHAFGEGDQILLEDYAEALRPLWAG